VYENHSIEANWNTEGGPKRTTNSLKGPPMYAPQDNSQGRDLQDEGLRVI